MKAVSLSALLVLAGVSSQLLAEERADVLERIAPIGKAQVEGQAQAAPAAAAEPAAVMAAPAEEAATAEAPAAEAPATEATAAAEAAAPAPAAAPAAGGDQLALATQSGCMACHQIDMKVVGPGYKEVAAKYKGDPAALDMLVAKVKNGGVGTWGQIPMPPNAAVSEENIRAIVTWVLSF